MSHTERARRLAERNGAAHNDQPTLKPRPHQWLINRILEACNGHPDGKLVDWLAQHQVFPDDITAWRERHTAAADWNDPGKVLLSVRRILDPPHPQAAFFLGWLHSIVSSLAPQNAELVPLAPPPDPEPAIASPTIVPTYLPNDVLAMAYERAGMRNPRVFEP